MAASLAFGILIATAILMLLGPALATVRADVEAWWEARLVATATATAGD